ncbi:DUF488 domain-containing protein [Methanofollis fontis]|uniref:DUF488 domain-containing protein n=1 Tax=Methanofollis fontis TaxID=2052832 RepID=A0A483CS85_9EURY|nr:DUF488 domain-containing protein [Methanofollis fontis]TAJ43945.1 hypothetical protein CUJ86_07775 [Methanofollis fontis]
MKNRKVFTIGTANRRAGEFIDLLREEEIAVLADVRSVPWSALDQFRKENLARLCMDAGIEYLWLGAALGGFRDEGYEAYMKTAAFRDALCSLEERAARMRTAICCAEAEPWRCHRWLIAGALHRRGWTVVHILGPGERMRHTDLSFYRSPPPT